MKKHDLGKTSSGLEANVEALLTYLAGWITGLIFFLIEKNNKFVRFHALQSIVVFGAFSILLFVLSILFSFFIMIHAGFMFPFFILLSKLVWLAAAILWVLLMVKAYQGEHFKLPIAGDIAEKNI